MGNLKSYIARGVEYVLHGIPVKKVIANISYTNPSDKLKGKGIVITGGAGGIGKAMAKRFINEGAKVLITGRNIVKLQSVARELGCEFLVLDITKIDSFAKFVDEANQKLDGINVLVNNAGISLHEQSFEEISTEGFDVQMDTNFKGTLFLTQAFVSEWLNKHEAGEILFVSSETGETVDDRPYGWTKSAINSMVKGLAHRLISKGIRINGIAPGITATEMTSFSDQGNLFHKSNISQRVYLPDEVAEVAAFILSDAAGCISGQIIFCNNGNTINTRWR